MDLITEMLNLFMNSIKTSATTGNVVAQVIGIGVWLSLITEISRQA